MNDTVSLTAAFGALWPILLAVGSGYIALLGLLRQQFEKRLSEKDDIIKKLESRHERMERVVWQSLSTAEAAAALTASVVPREDG